MSPLFIIEMNYFSGRRLVYTKGLKGIPQNIDHAGLCQHYNNNNSNDNMPNGSISSSEWGLTERGSLRLGASLNVRFQTNIIFHFQLGAVYKNISNVVGGGVGADDGH